MSLTFRICDLFGPVVVMCSLSLAVPHPSTLLGQAELDGIKAK